MQPPQSEKEIVYRIAVSYYTCYMLLITCLIKGKLAVVLCLLSSINNTSDILPQVGFGTAPDGPIIVNIREGTYSLNQTFGLSGSLGDSGTINNPIIWTSYNNEKVRIIGGIEVR